jgi:hypothetical protein
MRRPLVVVMALACGFTLVGGVAAASQRSSSSVRACASGGRALRLLKKNGKCPTGSTAVTLGKRGPRGATGAAGPAGPAGPTGPKGDAGGATGPAGPAGANGTNGKDGATILSGTGAPSSSMGAVGDYYIDTSKHTIYGPASFNAAIRSIIWGSGTSLIGPAGSAGSSGPQPSYTTSGDANMPNGAETLIATLTIPAEGDYIVTGTASGYHSGNDTTDWDCELIAQNPGQSSVELGEAYNTGVQAHTVSYVTLPLYGVVSIEASGTISVFCVEQESQKEDSASASFAAIPMASF